MTLKLPAAAKEKPSAAEVTRDELCDFGERVQARFGHEASIGRRDDLRLALVARMAVTGCTEYARYLKLLAANDREWVALAPLLTVPETYFFRMPDHFQALAEEVMPRLIQANAGTRRLRILTAGCATGEEPYSIKILLRERFPELAAWQVTITGIDLSEDALARARAGVYSEWSLRATSAERRRANFVALVAGSTSGAKGASTRYKLTAANREGVVFRPENLLDGPEDVAEPAYDLIFCRNVLIYFSEPATRRTIEQLSRRLVPGGYLFLGPAESLRGVSRNFHLCHTHEVFYYRRRQHLRDAEEAAPVAHTSPFADRPEPATPAAPTGGGAGTWYDLIRQSSSRVALLMPAQAAAAAAQSTPAKRAKPVPAAGVGLDSARFFALVAAERFADALALLDQPEASPTTEDHRVLRASMLANLGRFTEAERECRLLLKADELNAAAHYLLGFCLEQAGSAQGAEADRLERAREHMTMSTFLDPTFAMAHLHLGLLARQTGETATARSSLREALAALERDGADRLALFGGGFSRESLRQLCVRELERLES